MLVYTGNDTRVAESANQYNSLVKENYKSARNQKDMHQSNPFDYASALIKCENALLNLLEISFEHDPKWFNEEKPLFLSHIKYFKGSREVNSLANLEILDVWVKKINEFNLNYFSQELVNTQEENKFDYLVKVNEVIYKRLFPYIIHNMDSLIINTLAQQFTASLGLTLTFAYWLFPQWLTTNLSKIQTQLNSLTGIVSYPFIIDQFKFAENLVMQNNSRLNRVIGTTVDFIALPGYAALGGMIANRLFNTVKPTVDFEYKKISENNILMLRALDTHEREVKYLNDLKEYGQVLIIELNEIKLLESDLTESDRELLSLQIPQEIDDSKVNEASSSSAVVPQRFFSPKGKESISSSSSSSSALIPTNNLTK